MEDTPGVTRDRVNYKAEWMERQFTLVDTGGWEPDAKGINASVAAQAEVAIDLADAVLFVVDGNVGATATDEHVVKLLRKTKKPVYLLANKVDDARQEPNIATLWSLGLGEPYPVSALHGRGVADLLDLVIPKLPEVSAVAKQEVGGPRRVAILGRPNVGKSSLLNRLTDAGVLVENALFATLDPTVRKTHTADGRIYTLTDTVGFVRHLPHQLVDAFKSTLEEVSGADVIVHVVDGSHSDPFEQIRAVREVIIEIGGAEIPEIIAINKVDIADPDMVMQILRAEPNSYAFSVRSGFGVDGLVHAIEKSLPHPAVEISTVIPYHRGDLVSAIHETGEILSEEHLAHGTAIHAYVDGGLAKAIEIATSKAE